MAGDVITWAVSGQSPMFKPGDAIVAVTQQGTRQTLTDRRYNDGVNNVTVSGYYAARFDDVSYYV